MFLATLLVGAMAASASAGAVRITATDGNVFKPKIVRVSKGTKAVWRNTSAITHNVTATGGRWSKAATMAPGSATSFTFKRVGTYRYRCTLHSSLTSGKCTGMCGKVVVR
ncbi:MAG: plastocyanin/azurin family copper-binding protein [Actinobacteria bacterium]|nr:plastocyanin/azurin family copper-binding protein [Actinomycetota bacterium]